LMRGGAGVRLQRKKKKTARFLNKKFSVGGGAAGIAGVNKAMKAGDNSIPLGGKKRTAKKGGKSGKGDLRTSDIG